MSFLCHLSDFRSKFLSVYVAADPTPMDLGHNILSYLVPFELILMGGKSPVSAYEDGWI